jgi:peptide/nickel transport system permease protein
MAAYILKRTILCIPTLLAISLLVFTTIRIIPGDPAAALLADGGGNAGSGASSSASYEAMRERLGLNEPYLEAYWSWLSDVAQGDLGRSMRTGEEVSAQLSQRLPLTMEVTVFALVLSVVIGLPAGVVSAVRSGRWPDYAVRIPTVLLMAVPNFWLALLVLIVPFQLFGYSPPLNYVSLSADPVSNLRTVLPPAIVVGIGSSALIIRMTRTSLLDVLSEDYVRTARAKGLGERVVVYRHALKNALIPTLEIILGRVPALLGGVVVMETVFALPGLGRSLVDSVNWRDYTSLQALVVFNAAIVLAFNLFADVLYAWLDPRVRYG